MVLRRWYSIHYFDPWYTTCKEVTILSVYTHERPFNRYSHIDAITGFGKRHTIPYGVHRIRATDRRLLATCHAVPISCMNYSAATRGIAEGGFRIARTCSYELDCWITWLVYVVSGGRTRSRGVLKRKLDIAEVFGVGFFWTISVVDQAISCSLPLLRLLCRVLKR